MSTRIITGPTFEPVTLADTKLHCRIDNAYDDTLLTAYITAARVHAEALLHRCIATQTVEQWLDSLPKFGDVINLPHGPVFNLTMFRYLDSQTLVWTVVDPSVYVLDTVSNVAQLTPASNENWPTALDQANVVQIQYQSGFDQGQGITAIPAAIKIYIMSLVGAMYNNREAFADKAAVNVEFLERLLDPYAEQFL